MNDECMCRCRKWLRKRTSTNVKRTYGMMSDWTGVTANRSLVFLSTALPLLVAAYVVRTVSLYIEMYDKKDMR